MKDYEVTLSIPVYNVEKYIHTALFSALNQNFESSFLLLMIKVLIEVWNL